MLTRDEKWTPAASPPTRRPCVEDDLRAKSDRTTPRRDVTALEQRLVDLERRLAELLGARA